MKLSDLRTDIATVNQGAWVDDIPELPGLRLRVRPITSPLYRRRQSELLRALSASKRRDPVELEKIDDTLICEIILLEWDGLEDAPYAKETAAKLISDPEYGALRDAIMWAAAVVGERAVASIEADAKN